MLYSEVRIEVPPYTILPIRFEDILSIKQWRNDQLQILRQNYPITDADQIAYFKNVIEPTFSESQPRQFLFSYLLNGQCIGYGGLVHIDWHSKRAEVSFLLATERNNDIPLFCREFAIFVEAMQHFAFDQLLFHRLTAELYAIRPYVGEVLEQKGFVFEGCMREHVFKEDRYLDALIYGCIR